MQISGRRVHSRKPSLGQTTSNSPGDGDIALLLTRLKTLAWQLGVATAVVGCWLLCRSFTAAFLGKHKQRQTCLCIVIAWSTTTHSLKVANPPASRPQDSQDSLAIANIFEVIQRQIPSFQQTELAVMRACLSRQRRARHVTWRPAGYPASDIGAPISCHAINEFGGNEDGIFSTQPQNF